MKKILIALDHNTSSQKVAEIGYSIAKAMKAEISIAHVLTEPEYYVMQYIDDLNYGLGYISNLVENIEYTREVAHHFLNSIVLHLGDNTIHTILLDGEVEHAILKYGQEQKVDLIVIGSHRHTGIDKFLHTDLAVNIMLHSKIALLTIPTSEKLSEAK